MVTIKLNIISIKFFLNNNIERPLKGYIATGVVVGKKAIYMKTRQFVLFLATMGGGKGTYILKLV